MTSLGATHPKVDTGCRRRMGQPPKKKEREILYCCPIFQTHALILLFYIGNNTVISMLFCVFKLFMRDNVGGLCLERKHIKMGNECPSTQPTISSHTSPHILPKTCIRCIVSFTYYLPEDNYTFI